MNNFFLKKYSWITAILICFLQCTISDFAFAQELKCSVKINTPKLQNTDPKVFITLQKSMFEFFNNRKWTDDIFDNQEKIECNILINVTEEIGTDRFRFQLNVQSSRTIFNSSYSTTLFNWSDKDVIVQYVEYQPLDYADDKYTSNLTSIMAFYAYMMIGLDYDSYSLKGGSPYFDKAKNIATIMQNYDEEGWKPFEKNLKNRYWLADNITNARSESFRTLMYNYHRKGLDMMYQNADNGRAVISNAMKQVEKMYDENPNGVWLIAFFAAKSEELSNIFTQASPQEKIQMSILLNKCDPVNGKKYQKIMNSK
ncbi:MAG: hypothetical protein RL708_2493 [Bacteroidota bacterium]|jgi:hypothetical protein